jgi:uncharacterized protein
MKRAYLLLCAALLLLLAGCQAQSLLLDTPAAPTAQESALVDPSPTQPAAPTATATAVPSPTVTPSPTAMETPAPRATSSPTATPSPTPTVTPTPDPYAGLTIEDLRNRSYGGGELAIEQTLATTGAFTRTLITYPSDDLVIYGFMNVPVGEGPFPVAIVLHGYIDPAIYETLAYTTRYADALARAGYLVIHPNLRGYPPSDSGPNTFRVGMAIDVLNLLALVRDQAGPLAQADPDAIALMGHSMGGGITWRVLTIDQGVGAAVLYGSMHADEMENRNWRLRRGTSARPSLEMEAPEDDLVRISPSTYLADIVAPVSIHHSIHDQTVPYEWAEELAARMEELDKPAELFLYRDTPHTFRGEADQLFMQRMIAFFDAHLRPPAE